MSVYKDIICELLTEKLTFNSDRNTFISGSQSLIHKMMEKYEYAIYEVPPIVALGIMEDVSNMTSFQNNIMNSQLELLQFNDSYKNITFFLSEVICECIDYIKINNLCAPIWYGFIHEIINLCKKGNNETRMDSKKIYNKILSLTEINKTYKMIYFNRRV